jgi:hypothetical protein
MLDALLRRFDRVDPNLRRKAALLILLGSVVGWPLSALTFARGEPPFILGLSWMAISITALDVLLTSDVRAQEDGGDDA